MQVTGRTRIGGAAIAPVADAIRGGADDDLGEILLDDEVVADKLSGASGKGGAPLPVIENEPADVAKTKAKCDKTLQSLISCKLKVKSTLSRATEMWGDARPSWARSWTVPWTPSRPASLVWRRCAGRTSRGRLPHQRHQEAGDVGYL